MEREESIGKDATSKETLKDVEENDVSRASDVDEPNVPSPDGAFDESDELKKADPV
jgi:hypothetical protein